MSQRGLGHASAQLQAPVADRHTTSELGSMCVGIGLMGITALAGAAASSLIPGLGGTVPRMDTQSWVLLLNGAAGIASAGYGLAALGFGFSAFRRGQLPAVKALQILVSVAAVIHLAAFMAGLWGLPASDRSFDLTLAALLLLELTVTAAIGWQRNTALRRSAKSKVSTPRSAISVVGILFVASIFVAAVTTAGMAASTAGSLAVPHSGHGTPAVGVVDDSLVPSKIQELKNQGHQH